MLDLDTSGWTNQKQAEIRQPTPKGYFFDVVWVEPDLGKKGTVLLDNRGGQWTVHEVFGTRKMPGRSAAYKAISGRS